MAGFNDLREWAAAGYEIGQIGARHTSGAFAGYANLAITDEGTVSGMHRWKGVMSAPINYPDDTLTPVRGDNGKTKYSFPFEGDDTATVTMENAVTEIDVEALMQNSTVLTIGQWAIGGRGGMRQRAQDMMMLLTRDAIASDGSESSGYEHLLVPNIKFKPVGDDQYRDSEAGSTRYNATLNRAVKLPWGKTALVDLGMGAVMTLPMASEYPLTFAAIVGAGGAAAAITLPYAPISVAKTKVFRFDTGAEVTVSSVDDVNSTFTPAAGLTDATFHLIMWETLDLLVS